MTSIAILAWVVVSYHTESVPQLKYEILLRHEFVRPFLTLPSGYGLLALVWLFLSPLGVEMNGVADAVLVSLICSIAGYWQWFILLPWLRQKWEARKLSDSLVEE